MLIPQTAYNVGSLLNWAPIPVTRKRSQFGEGVTYISSGLQREGET